MEEYHSNDVLLNLREEEGGEHLRKRSMHLPFTFATGEAMLYQTSYPLHSFPDSLRGKAKSKKGKMDKSSDDDGLDPNSLLGALMSQDESVYVCQPASEPKMSFHSSLFGEQQGGGKEFGGTLGGEIWNAVPSGLTTGCNSEPASYDPLLATLDSLSLGGDETCSNSELFSALENLGLNAEDLELLLLDERMIRVEMDPDYVPSLNDLLTNTEILSYIHDTLDNRMGGEEQGDGGGSALSSHPPTPASAQNNTHHTQAFPTPTTHPVSSQHAPVHRQPRQSPIVQLTQQMQQHHGADQHAKAQPWISHSQDQTPSHSQPDTLETDTLTGLPNGHGHNHTHRPQTVLNGQGSLLDGELNHLNHLLESKQQRQHQQDQLLLQLQAHCHFKQPVNEGRCPLNGAHSQPPWSGYQNQLEPTTNGAYLPNGHTAFSQTPQIGHMDYNMANAPIMDVGVNGACVPDFCQYQRMVSATPSYQLPGHQRQQQQQQMLQHPVVPPTCFSQCPTQNAPLEQLLGLSQPQQGLPSLEAYGVFSTTTVTQEDPRSKVRDTLRM